MKPDISERGDIENIVNLFYEKVKKDKTIGFFFSDVIPVDWDKHITRMCSFWENVLFYSGEYEGNPLATHLKIHQRHPVQKRHYKKWIKLFDEAVDSSYTGPNADKMKQHAKGIALIMQRKTG